MNFRELLEDLSIDAAPENHHHGRAGWINIDCPLCGRDTRKYHLGISEAFGFMNCWKCGKQNIVQTLSELSGRPMREISLRLKGIDVVRPKEKIRTEELKLPKNLEPLSPAHKKYLRGRGFDPKEIADVWGVQGISVSSSLAWRLFIPIHYQGKIVSWTTRAIGEGLRYISASPTQETMNHKELLYGQDHAKYTIIIHEGPTDVWAIGKGAVATLGTAYTPSQILKMITFKKRIVCFDNERGARERAQELTDKLSMFEGETVNVVLDSEDPATASEEEKTRLRALAFN